MSKDYTAQMDALKAITTALGKKEEVDAALWEAAGLKPGTRLKDVQQQITKVKKMVSAQGKTAEEEEDEDGEVGPAGKERHGRQDQRAKKDVRRLGAEKKAAMGAMARGEMDMGVDRVFVGGDGELHTA